MVRLNITLPDEIARKLSAESNKSRFIAEALEEKFERERRKRLEHLMLKGYRAESGDDTSMNADWEPTDTEGWE